MPPATPGSPAESCFTRVAGSTPIERCCHLRLLLLEEPDAKTALPLRPGRAVAVNAMTAHPRGIARRPRTVRSNSVRTRMHLSPQWEYSSQYSHNCVVVRILPVRPRGDCG